MRRAILSEQRPQYCGWRECGHERRSSGAITALDAAYSTSVTREPARCDEALRSITCRCCGKYGGVQPDPDADFAAEEKRSLPERSATGRYSHAGSGERCTTKRAIALGLNHISFDTIRPSAHFEIRSDTTRPDAQ